MRKWIVRGLVFSIVGGCAVAAWLYQRWTNPSAVRQQVLLKLQQMFPGATVTLDSARLRLLGGISLTELRLTRREGGERPDLLHIPSAVLHHDKEKLMDGVLQLRKVELREPRLHLVREKDGSWNIEGLTGADQPRELVPTFVIRNGTLTFEDRSGSDFPRVEIHGVNLTLINDPAATLIVDGTARCDLFGALQLRGSWDRDERGLSLSVRSEGLPITNALARRLAAQCPMGSLAGLQLEGTADLSADLTLRPDASPLWRYDVRCQVRQGTLRHPQLPLPLEDLRALLRLADGVMRIDKLQARSGAAQVTGSGMALLPCPERDFTCSVQVRQLHLCDKLFEQMPKKLQRLNDMFLPAGPATLEIDCACRDGQWTALAGGEPSRVALLPEGLKVLFERFKYPLDRLGGRIDYNLQTQLVSVDVTGFTGPRPVHIKGTWQGEGVNVASTFDIAANDVPLDAKLLAALPETYQKLAASFHASGLADIRAHIRHAPGEARFHQEYRARLHGVSLQWEQFPYPLDNVNGFLDIFPDYWEFRSVRGTRRGGEVVLQGRSTPQPDGRWGVAVELAGRNVALDADLKAALKPYPAMAKAWEAFAPSGRLDFAAKIARTPLPPGVKGKDDPTHDLDIVVTARGGTVTPTFFPCVFADVAGNFRFHNQRLEATEIRARHKECEVAIDWGVVDVFPGGGYKANVHEIRADRLRLDNDFAKALPAALQSACVGLDLRDPIDLKTQLLVHQGSEPGALPVIFWDGQVWLHNARLTTGVELSGVTGIVACRGNYNLNSRRLDGLVGNIILDQAVVLRQPFRNVHANFSVPRDQPDVLNLRLWAPLFGGNISGELRFDFALDGRNQSGSGNQSGVRYQMNLTASQINLQEFARHHQLGPNTQLQGHAVGRLVLAGQGGNIETLDGDGSLDVNSGRLLNLPLLLDLLKFLGLRWPDRTFFEEAHAIFAIRGRRVSIRRLQLVGNAISLTGKGDVNIDGTDLNVDFYPSWARVEQIVPPVLRMIPAEISKGLMKIEARGKVTGDPKDVKFVKKPLPVMLDPLWQLRERTRGDMEWRAPKNLFKLPEDGGRY